MDTQLTQGESSTSQFSHPPLHWNYDVFLSFRGEDTRKTFTGHLHSRLCQVGVNTFIDDEELRKGEVISRELEKAIEGSRISIVIFSKDYASSRWCLNELVKILECKSKLKQIVLPVFYHVDPSQVRKQAGGFGDALARHKERFGAQGIDKWITALTEVANLSGWDLQNVADGHEAKFIESIIQQVQQEVNHIPLDVAWHPVGVDARVKYIELLLNECEDDEVQMLGIYGNGGIGKTTLAKALYNRIFRYFDGSCFLPNVRSEAEAFGLVKLQENLLHQILKTKDFKVSSVAEGVNLIKARLGSKKVLIVLDDLDHLSQLHSLARDRSWFGSSSLIIITTRDEHLLCGLGENERYKANLLNDNEAMQLFSLHSFNHLFPPQEYIELAQCIVKYSGGLPLALATLGSHLQGKTIKEWRLELKKLKEIPHPDIQKILMISCDGLDCDTRSVFLDIACFFLGFSKDVATVTLDACGYHCELAIATLVRKCLLQRNGYWLEMHDLVRDMGREIIRMESPQDPGRRSRLFNPQEVRDVLQGNKGSEKVEVLKLDAEALEGVKLSTKTFEKMRNLRVLQMDDLDISGDFELLSKELRWLSWQKCRLKYIPSNFPAEKLVYLDMQGSNIQEFGLNLQCCKSLKKLDLSDCKRLRRTPNFDGSRSLETLKLVGCSTLTEIHPSIGSLDRLVSLYLRDCVKLRVLPSSICQLKSLQDLDITNCSSIRKLPVNLGDMHNLKYLLADRSGINELPDSVKMLRNILLLEVGGQNLEAKSSLVPRRVHHIQSLSTSLLDLILAYRGLSGDHIPGDIGSVFSLVVLDLSGRIFRHLPLSISKLQSLVNLSLNNCENLQTHSPVSNLEELRYLELANCKNFIKIELDNLPAIKEMNMVNCSSQLNPFNEGFFAAPTLALQSRKDQHRMREELNIYLQCNEIPDWCNNQVTASSVCFIMPTPPNEYMFLGMILWFVRESVKVPFPSRQQGLTFTIAEVSRSYSPRYYKLPARRRELSCAVYRSFLEPPSECLLMMGGEKVQVSEVTELGEENTVKKIGIHLLYLDQQGAITSFPAFMDHSHKMKRSLEINEISVEEEYPGVSIGQGVPTEHRFVIWSSVSSFIRFLTSCFSP